MKWTTEYPTQPGYYWIKNYTAKMGDYERLAPFPDIVEIRKFQYIDDDGLRVKLLGESIPLKLSDFTQAEWCGPIQPPQDESKHPETVSAAQISAELDESIEAWRKRAFGVEK